MRTTLLLTVLLSLGCGGAAAEPVNSNAASDASDAPDATAAQSIVLHRDHHAGDRFVATLRGESQTRNLLTVNGQPNQDERLHVTIELVAEFLIQEVNADGKPTSTQVTVRSCTTGGDAAQEVLPPGSVLLVTAVEAPGEGSVTLQGGELNDDQRARLELVTSTHISTRGDDDVFGTTEPQTVGATWPVNAMVAAEDLSRIPTMSFNAENISGETTFAELAEIDGVPCQLVHSSMVAQDFTLSGLPEGSITQSSSLEMRMGGAFPLDVSRQRLRSRTEMAMRMVVQLPAPNGAIALMTITTLRAKTAEIHP